MSHSRLLDIIIPTYNRPKRLFTLLKSGLNLNLENVYFIVIDDGSQLSEHIEEVGSLSTQQVCEFFNNERVLYFSNPSNIGLAASWVKYYQDYCDAKYSLSIVDKDIFIDAKPILSALQKLEEDDELSMVVIPLRQEDRCNHNLLIDFNYSKMSGYEFISHFIQDPSLQHCSSYGIKRVSHIKGAKVPHNLNLKKYNLDDGFGIDIHLILKLASMGSVNFETEPHIKRVLMEGATERYPLTFAYTYYQYAKYVIEDLKQINAIQYTDVNKYIYNWLILILRGLIVSYQPVHGSELEKRTTRIRKHLKVPIHWYLLYQMYHYKIPRTEEFNSLYLMSLRLTYKYMQKRVLNLFIGRRMKRPPIS